MHPTMDSFIHMSHEAGGDKTTAANDKMIPLIGPVFSPVTLLSVMWLALHVRAG